MSTFQVIGGKPLSGEVTPQGAKNEALQILCAVLLTPDRVVIHNVPRIIDVLLLIKLLERMGVEVERVGDKSYAFHAKEIDFKSMESDEFIRDMSRIRGSVMMLGPMLARYGKGYIPRPGGDKIGRRRLDTHFNGFVKLGAKFNYDGNDGFYHVSCDRLKG